MLHQAALALVGRRIQLRDLPLALETYRQAGVQQHALAEALHPTA